MGLSKSLASLCGEVRRLRASIANATSYLDKLYAIVRGELLRYRKEIEYVEQWHFAFEHRNATFIQRILSTSWREPEIVKVVEE